MKMNVFEKESGEKIATVSLNYSENPVEAILNWCDNMGYRFVEIEWSPAGQ